MPHFPKPFFKQARGLWYVQVDGRQVNLGPDQTAAFRRYHQLMQQPQRRLVSDELVASLADAFLEWVEAHRAPDSYEWYRYRLQRFCQRYPDLRTADLKPFHVQQWVDSYPDLSRTSQRNYFRAVKRCLKWAQQQGHIETNPIALMVVPVADRRETLVTADEFAALLECIRSADFRDLVLTTWETGCRPQESLRVEAKHVDLVHNRWVFPIRESKGRKAPRVVYLTDAALEITRRRMAMYPEGPLFRNGDGDPWTTCAVNNAFHRIQIRLGRQRLLAAGESVDPEEISTLIERLKPTKRVRGRETPKTPLELRGEAKRKLTARLAKSRVPQYSLYALRHSWATRALQSGVDALTVAILMGHSDPSTLARVYQHLAHNPEHMRSQLQRATITT